MLRTRSFEKTTIDIDGEAVLLRIARMSVTQWTEFSSTFLAFGRDADRAKQALDEKQRQLEQAGVKLAPGDLLAAFEGDLSPAERQARRAEIRAAREAGDQFTIESIVTYVTVEPGQIIDEDTDADVTTGEQLVTKFGSRPDVLSAVMAEIYLQNRLSDADKKKLSLLRASARSSSKPAAVAGPTPDAIAANVESSSTVEREAVTA